MAPFASELACWLAAAMTVQAPAETTPEEFRAIRVEVVGFDEAAVMGGLRLRLPRLEIARHDASPPQASPHAYLKFTRDAQLVGRIRIITSEGRAYERTFTIDVGEEVRTAASTAANLLLSIEQGTVAPDQVDAAIPEMQPPEPAPSVPEPAPTEPAPTEPAPIEPASSAPQPSSRPATTVRPASGSEPPGWELGAGLVGVGVLALGPPAYGGPFAGAGGGLGLEARTPRGVALALDARGLGQGDSTFTVGRLRIGLAAGFAWRRRRFELPVLLGASVEPWWAVQSGAPAPLYSGDAVVKRPLLVGGYVRVTPALRFPVVRGPLAAVRLGPRFELAGSFTADKKADALGLSDVTGQSRARLGGLEVTIGLEVALQWSLAGARSR